MERKQIIPVEDILVDSILADDVFAENKTTLLVSGTKLTAEGTRLLRQYHIQSVAILNEGFEHPATFAALADNEEIIHHHLIDDVLQADLLQGVGNVFAASANFGQQLEELQAMMQQVVAQLQRHTHALLHINTMQQEANALFLHSINVSLFAVILGLVMKVPTEELALLGLGGLLHDIGKMQLDGQLVNKAGKLTIEEYEVMKQHSLLGYSILKQEPKLDHRVGLMVLQHHERCNGKGYPWGRVEEQIHPLSRIIAVADVYEALTANRSYRAKFSADKAIYMVNDSGVDNFSTDVLRAFNSVAVPYNIGEVVTLNNGLTGRVTALNSQQLARPCVFTPKGKINLLEYPDLYIASIV